MEPAPTLHREPTRGANVTTLALCERCIMRQYLFSEHAMVTQHVPARTQDFNRACSTISAKHQAHIRTHDRTYKPPKLSSSSRVDPMHSVSTRYCRPIQEPGQNCRRFALMKNSCTVSGSTMNSSYTGKIESIQLPTPLL